jgi:hypothetical protein
MVSPPAMMKTYIFLMSLGLGGFSLKAQTGLVLFDLSASTQPLMTNPMYDQNINQLKPGAFLALPIPGDGYRQFKVIEVKAKIPGLPYISVILSIEDEPGRKQMPRKQIARIPLSKEPIDRWRFQAYLRDLNFLDKHGVMIPSINVSEEESFVLMGYSESEFSLRDYLLREGDHFDAAQIEADFLVFLESVGGLSRIGELRLDAVKYSRFQVGTTDTGRPIFAGQWVLVDSGLGSQARNVFTPFYAEDNPFYSLLEKLALENPDSKNKIDRFILDVADFKKRHALRFQARSCVVSFSQLLSVIGL